MVANAHLIAQNILVKTKHCLYIGRQVYFASFLVCAHDHYEKSLFLF